MSASVKTESYEVVTASIPSSKIPSLLRNKLHPLLPYSLPLYRRYQFHLYENSRSARSEEHPNGPGQPEVWIAVSRPKPATEALANDWLGQWLEQPQHPPTTDRSSTTSNNKNDCEGQWLACFIDLREPGQTQIWTFGSWEAILTPVIMSPPDNETDDISVRSITPSQQQTSIGQSLFHHLRTQHIPPLSMKPSTQYLTMKAAGKLVSSPYKRTKILFGTIAESSWWMLEDEIVIGQASTGSTVITREDRPYLKYILSLPLSHRSSPPMPPNLTPAPLSTPHLQTVLDRSVIPRALEQLQRLTTVGLFPDDPNSDSNPVSWGLLARDSSLSSLHTEPGYRGQGLAEVVSRELIRRMGEMFRTNWVGGEDGELEVEYAHVDVSPGNVASRRVFEKMGAKVGWRVGWIEVDVDVDIGETQGINGDTSEI